MPRIDNLQYLRAVAALLVVFFHAAVNSGLSFPLGVIGVDIFFVISGFLMWTITAKEASPIAFMRDRVRRIVPNYWIVTLVVAAVVALGLTRESSISLPDLAQSLFFVPHESPKGGVFPVVQPGWTLNYEMFFYALFAGCLLFKRSIRAWAISALLAGLVVIGYWLEPSSAAGAFYANPIMIEFAFGIWLGVWWERGFKPDSAVIGVMALLGLIMAIGADGPRLFMMGVPALLFVAAALVAPSPRWPFLRLLGDASYSIYLWHAIAVSICLRAVLALDWPLVTLMVLGPVAGVALGLLVYRFVEAPLLRRKGSDGHIILTHPDQSKVRIDPDLIVSADPEGPLTLIRRIGLPAIFVRESPDQILDLHLAKRPA